MKISIFGTGYVGLVTGACLAEYGHQVLCVDTNAEKIALLKNGGIPIYEPGLDDVVKNNIKAGRLHFTTDAKEAIEFGRVIFIAVGTPPDEDGSADITAVISVAKTIATHMTSPKLVVNKSTVPVGSADKVRETIQANLKNDIQFSVASNPEFLKEGAAVKDFMSPDRIVIGCSDEESEKLLSEIYAPLVRQHDRIIAMDVRSAELTKYAANAMLATKISFMNELSRIAEKVGADIENVRIGIGSDSRIGYSFIYPGVGYGGSCFPKDVKALAATARAQGVEPRLIQAVEDVNARQKQVLVDKIVSHFGEDLSGKTFAMWGLAFKPNTDDMREAPSRVIMEALWEKGATVRAYDPEAMEEAQRIYKDTPALTLTDTAMAACEGADALLVVTEWKAFRAPDFDEIKAALNSPVIFDGRNMYDPASLKAEGFAYYAIGRA